MKNIFIYSFILFSILIAISSCASVKKNNKTLCECLEIVLNNPEIRKDSVPPVGCEWLKDIPEEEGQKLILKTQTDCPEIFQKLFGEMHMNIEDGGEEEAPAEEAPKNKFIEKQK